MCDVEFVEFAVHCVSECVCVCLFLCRLTVRSSSSGQVSLRCRLERARGGVDGGSRNSLSSWSELTWQGTSPTKAWASLAVMAMENPLPCRGEIECNAQSVGTELYAGEINSCIYTHHIMSNTKLSWVFSLVMSGKYTTATQNMSARSNYKD